MFRKIKALFSAPSQRSTKDRPKISQAELDSLMKQANSLAKPCVLLRKEGVALAAVWGDAGVLPAPGAGLRHWISIDCSFLPIDINVGNGVLSVYSGGTDRDAGVAVFKSNATLDVGLGVPLFAHEGVSLPPPDAVAELDNPAYLDIWTSNCPIYGNDAVAVIGGWHFPWPDGDWEELRSQSLLVWTLADSEPWVEVWKDGDRFSVLERIT